MMQQIYMLERVAEILAEIEENFVFTGGATVCLYLEEIAALDIRPTDDVDCVVEIASRSEYYRLIEKLRQIGLEESTEPNAPLCRWQYQNIKIDIMPCDESILGFTNRWYSPGINRAINCQLPNGRTIQIFSVPYLLASKIEAFLGRGNDNFYYSSDVEDIIALLDGCPYLEEAIEQTDTEVREFVLSWFAREKNILEELAFAFLSPAAKNAGRDRLLRDLLNRLVS